MVLLTSLYVVRINEEKISEEIKDTPKRYKVCNTYERGKLLHVGTFLSETIQQTRKDSKSLNEQTRENTGILTKGGRIYVVDLHIQEDSDDSLYMGLIHTEVHNVMKNNRVGQEEARLSDRARGQFRISS